MRKALYPGTFDPITYGHLDIILRAAEIFDEVIVAVATDNNKSPLFNTEERINLVKEGTIDIPNVTVEGFSGLTVDFAKKCNAKTIVRGLRAIADFEYEMQLALMNKKLASDIETIFLMTESKYSFISSSSVKQAANLGGNISEFVPPVVEKALVNKLIQYKDLAVPVRATG